MRGDGLWRFMNLFYVCLLSLSSLQNLPQCLKRSIWVKPFHLFRRFLKQEISSFENIFWRDEWNNVTIMTFPQITWLTTASSPLFCMTWHTGDFRHINHFLPYPNSISLLHALLHVQRQELSWGTFHYSFFRIRTNTSWVGGRRGKCDKTGWFLSLRCVWKRMSSRARRV